MALVRKYKTAGAIDEPKKVLKYENVGDYDADTLAAALTLDIENQANKLKLTGLARLDFLHYGATLILAVKDGNVTKNVDGTFSINGDYGLNNTFTDEEVAEKHSQGEVGYGAEAYKGQKLVNHGIFTTKGTKNFRNTNHTLGLVGQWLNSVMKTQDLNSSARKNFNLLHYIVNKLYRNDAGLRKEWDNVHSSQADKFGILATELSALTDEDYINLANTDSALGGADNAKQLVSELITNLQNNNVTEARKSALKLGFPLSSIISYDTVPDSQNFRQIAIDKLGIGASELEVNDYAELLRLNDEQTLRNKTAQALQDQLERLWATFSESEKYKVRDLLNNDTWSLQEFLDPENGDKDSRREAYETFIGRLHNALQNLIDNLPNLSSPDSTELGFVIDLLVDTYDYINKRISKKLYDKYSKFYTDLSNDLYEKVKYAQQDWILFRHLSTLKYSILYDPLHNKIIRVSNSLLEPGTLQYENLKNAFKINHRAFFNRAGGQVNDGYITSLGDVLDFGIFDEDKSKPETPEDTPKAEPLDGVFEVSDDNSEWTDIDTARLTAAGLDLASFIASITGVGSVGSAAAGIGATAANLYADLKDPNVSGLAAGANFGIGLVGDVVSVLPYVGAIRKAKKLLSAYNVLSKGVQTLMLGQLGYNIYNYQEHLDNIQNFINNPSWKNATDASHSLMFLINIFTTKKNINRAQRDSRHYESVYKMRALDGTEYNLPIETYNSIKNAPTYEEANAIFKKLTGNPKADLPYTKTELDKPQLNLNGKETEVLPLYYTEDKRGNTYAFKPAPTDRWFSDGFTVGDWLSLFGGGVGKRAVRAYDWLSGYRHENMPAGSIKHSEDRFLFGDRTYTKGADGKYHQDSPEMSKENIENYNKQQQAKKQLEKEAADKQAQARAEAHKKAADKVFQKGSDLLNKGKDKVKRFGVGLGEKFTSKTKPAPEEMRQPAPVYSPEYRQLVKLPGRKPGEPAIKEWAYIGETKVYKRPLIRLFNDKFGSSIPEDYYLSRQQFEYMYKAYMGLDTKKEGGVLELTRNIAELLKDGGILKAAKGWRVGDEYFDSEDAAKWYKQFNNLTDDVQEADYDFDDWYYGDLWTAWEDAKNNNTFTPSHTDGNIPWRAGATLLAQDILNEPDYQEFTKYIFDALNKGELNPRLEAYLKRLLEYIISQNPHGRKYFDEDSLIQDMADYFQKMRTDDVYGWHHFNPLKRKSQEKIYLNGKLVEDEDQIANLKKQQAVKQYIQNNDKESTTHIFYEEGNPLTSAQGQTGTELSGKKETLTQADPNLYADLDITNRINWGNVNEILRVGMLNNANVRAHELEIDWQPAQAGYLHRNEILEGDYLALKNAQLRQANLSSLAGQTRTTDAATQFAGELQATYQGNILAQGATLADSNKFYDSRHKIQEILNLDLAYNRLKADANLAAIAEKDRFDAASRAQLTMTNATNLSNLMAGFSEQMFKKYNSIQEMLKQRQLLKEANRRAAAARVFLARIDALDKSDPEKYKQELKQIQDEYLETIGAYDAEDTRTMRKIMGRRILITPDLKSYYAKKGRKLTAHDHYILQASKDYNKRNLAEAREFYKNIRENNKKRKT